MMNITEILNLARERAGIKSDVALTHRLKVNVGAVRDWRMGRCLPRPETMAELCELAGIDKGLGLLWLMSEKSKGKAKAAFTSIRDQYARSHSETVVHQ